MVRRYNDSNYRELIRPPQTSDGSPQIMARRTAYGSLTAESYGMVPVTDYPDIVPDWSELKDWIAACEEEKVFPVAHSREKGIFKDGFDQDGLGYCWAWSAAGTLMTCRGAENQETVQLAPNSLGWLVGWQNQGYYLDATIKGMRERGVASREFVPGEHDINPKNFKSGWEEDALKYRVLSWWDTKRSSSTQDFICQCLGIMATGRPLYVAYNWWGHAVQVHGVKWDESEENNLVWFIQNSHGDDDIIEMTGSRAIPDEAYGVRSTT